MVKKWYYEKIGMEGFRLGYRSFYYRYNLKSGMRQKCSMNHGYPADGNVTAGVLQKRFPWVRVISDREVDRALFLLDYWEKRDLESEQTMEEVDRELETIGQRG